MMLFSAADGSRLTLTAHSLRVTRTMEYLIVKFLHVLSSTLLFGTGLGSAFYMFFTNLSGDVRAIAIVSRRVVWADWLFTTPTAIIQPLTGLYLVHLAGLPLSMPWLAWS